MQAKVYFPKGLYVTCLVLEFVHSEFLADNGRESVCPAAKHRVTVDVQTLTYNILFFRVLSESGCNKAILDGPMVVIAVLGIRRPTVRISVLAHQSTLRQETHCFTNLEQGLFTLPDQRASPETGCKSAKLHCLVNLN